MGKIFLAYSRLLVYHVYASLKNPHMRLPPNLRATIETQGVPSALGFLFSLERKDMG
jgi:hypothetical protein